MDFHEFVFLCERNFSTSCYTKLMEDAQDNVMPRWQPKPGGGGGVVEITNDTPKAIKVASKVLPVVLGASALTGAAGVLNHAKGAESDNGVKVEFIPSATTPSADTNSLTTEITHPEISIEKSDLFDTVFHDLNDTQKKQAREEVDMFKGRIIAKTGYEQEHLAMPIKYYAQIEQSAKAYGISVNTLLGLVSIENGGGEAVLNKDSGALGVAQFLPETARQYGLHVNSEFDERTNAPKSIAAAANYLEDSKQLFGDEEGIALWSYHAGAGNVYRALRVYFQDVNHVDIGDYAGAIVANDPKAREHTEAKAKELIKKDKLDVFKLLNNKAVHDQVLAGLEDYTETYVPQIVALNEIMKDHINSQKDQTFNIGGGLKVSVPANTFPTRE
jgi:hypothetical protein